MDRLRQKARAWLEERGLSNAPWAGTSHTTALTKLLADVLDEQLETVASDMETGAVVALGVVQEDVADVIGDLLREIARKMRAKKTGGTRASP